MTHEPLKPNQFYFVETRINISELVTTEDGFSTLEEVREHLESYHFPQWVVDSAMENLGLDHEVWNIKISVLNNTPYEPVKLVKKDKFIGIQHVRQPVIPLANEHYNGGVSPQSFCSLFGGLNENGLINRVEIQTNFSLRSYASDSSGVILGSDKLVIKLEPLFTLLNKKGAKALESYLAAEKLTIKRDIQQAILNEVLFKNSIHHEEHSIIQEWLEKQKASNGCSELLQEPEKFALECNVISASLAIAEHCSSVFCKWLSESVKI